MSQHDIFDSPQPVSAIFWECVSLGEGVSRLLRAGFSDSDIYAVGVLAGANTDFTDFLTSLGIPMTDSLYFNQCFEDGAIVLIVRSRTARDKRRALDVIQHSGGHLPPSCDLPRSAAS